MASQDQYFGGRRFRIGLTGFAFAALCVLQHASARAQAPEPQPIGVAHMFDIPSQPIASALQNFSAVTGVEVLYESRIAIGRRSADVSGRMTARQALVVLLGGTDIVVRYVGARAITLAGRSDEAAAAPEAPGLSLDPLDVVTGPRSNVSTSRLFAQSLQADVQTRLNRDPRTRSGSYRAAITLWIDGGRTVRRSALAETTGDAGRDAAIVEALKGLVLSRDIPANASQPVHLAITVRAN